MQKAFIIIIMVIFIVTSIGFYVAMMGPNVSPEQQEQEQRQEAARPDLSDIDVDFDIPEYVQAAGVEFTGAEDMTGQDSVTIDVGDNSFTPTVIQVDVGTNIEWVNNGAIEHSVVTDGDSPTGEFDSGLLALGETFSYTFDVPGEYHYLCEQHPASMRAAVLVVE